MKTLISGHRLHKLLQYDIDWIKVAIHCSLRDTFLNRTGYGLSGMADGVDLWFLQDLVSNEIPYCACIPFEKQAEYMSEEDRDLRAQLIECADAVELIRNSAMVEKCDVGLIVWDGNKGGTHNVFQQMIEAHKSFVWINPAWESVHEIKH